MLWNIFSFFHILGMSSSQLTFIFFRGVQTPLNGDLRSMVIQAEHLRRHTLDGFHRCWKTVAKQSPPDASWLMISKIVAYVIFFPVWNHEIYMVMMKRMTVFCPHPLRSPGKLRVSDEDQEYGIDSVTRQSCYTKLLVVTSGAKLCYRISEDYHHSWAGNSS